MSSLTPQSLSGYRIDQPLVGPIPHTTKSPSGESSFRAEADSIQRIDGSHQPSSLEDADDLTSQSGTPTSTELTTEQRDHWLRLHASDLIDQLQRWSLDLDARQAQLNSASASHDLRERQIRIRQQAIDDGLQQQQLELDEITREVKAQARRLAFQFD